MATLAITAGLDVFSSGMGLLKGHQIRAADAQNENASSNNAVDAYTSTMDQVADAVNTGKTDPGTAAQYMQQYDQYIESYMQKQVGKPGTEWNGSGHCDKHCTVGCCIYTNYLGPTSAKIVAALKQVQQGGGSVSVTLPAMSGSKYGFRARSPHTITFTPPHIQSIASAASTVATAVTAPLQSTLQKLGLVSGGSTPVAATAGYPVPAQGSSGISITTLLLGGIGLMFVLVLALVVRK